MAKLFEELKRRKVFRIAAVYAVVAWVLIQVADVVLPTFGTPAWVNQTLIFLFIIGLPIAVVLAWAYEATPEGIKPDIRVQPVHERQAVSAQPINYLILVIVLLVAGFQVADRMLLDNSSVTPTEIATGDISLGQPTFRSELNLGNLEQRPEQWGGYTSRLSLTGDGSTLIYSAFEEGTHRLYRRDLNQLEPQLIYESQNAFTGIASPDGEQVLLQEASVGLQIISITGGTPRTLANSGTSNVAQWLDNDNILFWSEAGATSGWNRVSTSGGEASLLVEELDNGISRGPWVLPESKGILYSTRANRLARNNHNISVVDFDSAIPQELIRDAYAPRYVESGHILFMRDDDLWAVPFDYADLQITGPERPVIYGVENAQSGRQQTAAYTVSETGMLAYLPGEDVSAGINTRLVWLDGEGNEELLDLPEQTYQDPAISPDGRRLSIGIVQFDGSQDIWVHPLSQPGILNQVTRSNDAINGIWTPDGQSLVYSDGGGRGIWQTNAAGTGIAQQILEEQVTISARSFTPAGDMLIDHDWYGEANIFLLQPTDVETPRKPVLTDEFQERAPTLSSDGRLLAYRSNETGNGEVYVRPYPDVNSNKWRISVDGGSQPKWDPKRNLLHYVTPESILVSVEIQVEPEFEVSERREIPIEDYFLNNTPAFDVHPVTDRFLFMKHADDEANDRPRRDGSEPALIVLVHNWFDELNALVPPDPQ